MLGYCMSTIVSKEIFLEKHLRLSYLYDVFPAGMREQSLSNTISCEYL